MGPYDAAPRDWELAGFTFEVCISATAYAQLKRHRLSTQLVSAYSPRLGLRVPPSLADAGLQHMLEEAASVCGEWEPLLPGGLAGYLLTNAHRRRVVLHLNARELYHVSRLRMDSHAQWDIRELAGEMVKQASKRAPLTMAGAGGKSELSGR
jgi:thymidylate synthase ThyX